MFSILSQPPSPSSKSMYHIDLNLGKEYAAYVTQIEQVIIVFGLVHILQVLQDPNKELFSNEFLQSIILLILGVSFYFLVWKKLIKFVYEDEKVEGFRSTFRLFK